MNVIYLTTAMVPADFTALNQRNSAQANPSNQNFHFRLLCALQAQHHTTAICYRPLPRYGRPFYLPYESKVAQAIAFHYLPLLNLPLFKQQGLVYSGFSFVSKMISLHPQEKPLLLVDAMNATLRRLGKRIQKRFGITTIGIVTDNPYLLSGVASSWAYACIKDMRFFDAFITLTSGLNRLVNPNHKPTLVLPGVIDEAPIMVTKTLRPYFFFAGALHERYGINNLLMAFKKLDCDVDLLIAGHGPDRAVTEVTHQDARIKYLGQLSASEVRTFESGAICNVNPRPLDAALDDFSIPSKFFEYLASGTITVSTRHPSLVTLFEHHVVWAGNGTMAELEKALITTLQMDDDTHKEMAEAAQEAMQIKFGINPVGQLLAQFTNSLK